LISIVKMVDVELSMEDMGDTMAATMIPSSPDGMKTLISQGYALS